MLEARTWSVSLSLKVGSHPRALIGCSPCEHIQLRRRIGPSTAIHSAEANDQVCPAAFAFKKSHDDCVTIYLAAEKIHESQKRWNALSVRREN